MTQGQAARGHLVERAMGRMPGFEKDGVAGAAQENEPAPPISAAPSPVLERPKPAAPTTRRAIDLGLLHAAGLVMPPDKTRRNRVLEELAMVRQQVLRGVDSAAPDPRRARIVLIASALPLEGKSFIALNLAASMARSGARHVVLIDADGRSGSMTDLLGTGGMPGLRDLVTEPDWLPAQMLLPTAIDRLRFLPHGKADATGQAPPAGSTMAAAIERLATSRPDHVLVIDSPPCLSTSDCSALAPVAGQVVLVVDAERTLRNEVEAALDVLEACPVLQLLLNRLRLTVNDTFGARGDYGAANAD